MAKKVRISKGITFHPAVGSKGRRVAFSSNCHERINRQIAEEAQYFIVQAKKKLRPENGHDFLSLERTKQNE